MILAWRRHIAASLFKKILPIIDPPTENPEKVEQPTLDGEEDDDGEDDVDKDIEEQLLHLNEQQRKEAKRFANDFHQ